MKKFLVMLAVVGAVFGSAAQGNEIGEKILLYLPNRIIDLFDIFSLNLGIGPVAEARLMGTRCCDVGAGYGMTCKMFKDYNRQYGFGIEEGWYWSFIFCGEEEYSMAESTPWVHKYIEMRSGVPQFDIEHYSFTKNYDPFQGPRDFWAIGGSLGFIVDANFYLHPMEWLDLGAGFFFIDLRNDDLILDDFR